MISFLQNSLQKHHRLLLAMLLVVMIFSFVLAGFLQGPGHSSFEGKYVRGEINLTDARATREARELAAMQTGASPDEFLKAAQTAAYMQKNGQPVTDRAFSILIGIVDRLQSADQLGIPTPNDKTLAAFIRSNPAFSDGTPPAFSAAKFKSFSDTARDRAGLDETRLRIALGNLWRLEKLQSVTAPEKPPGLDPLAVRAAEKMLTKWTVETAVMERAGFKPAIARDDKAVAAYYETNKEQYRVREKLRLRVARIPGDPKAVAGLPEPTREELIALAERRRDKFPLFGTVAEDTFLKDNRPAILAVWREEKSGEAAAVKLSESLITAIPVGTGRPDDAKVDALIKAAGLVAKPLPAYSVDSIPSGTGIPDALLTGALKLNATDWRSGAMTVGSEAFVFFYDGVEPSRIPPLAEVLAKVTADRDAAETERLFAEAANAKAVQIAAAVKAGKNFAEAATAAGLKPAPAANFERRSPPQNLAGHIESLDTLAIGGVPSTAFEDAGNRIVLHLVGRIAPDNIRANPLVQDAARYFAGAANAATAKARSEVEEN